MELRSRDQVWQLLVAIGAAAAVLVVAGMVVFGGNEDGTATVGLTVPEGEDGQLVAGPSDGGDREDGGSQRRSGGPIDGDEASRAGSKPIVSVQTSQTTVPTTPPTTVPTTVPTTTGRPTTTTGRDSTATTDGSNTSGPKSTVQLTTTVESSTTASTTAESSTTGPSTTGPTTKPSKPVRPTVTIGPIESLPPVGKDHSITPKDLAAARKQWRSMGYDSYGMTVTRFCFCPNSGPLEVVVRNGELQSVGPPGRDGDRDVFDRGSLTVPGLFNLIESAFDADGLQVVFDKSTGVPLSIEIDYIRRAIDDELTVTVRDFRPHRNR